MVRKMKLRFFAIARMNNRSDTVEYGKKFCNKHHQILEADAFE
jgi:hypothetical protein